MRRRVIVLTVLALAAVGALAWASRTPPRPPRTIDDAGFTARAGRECTRVVADLRAPRQEGGQFASPGPEQQPARVSARVTAVADGLERLAARLRTIPVDARDRDEVAQWLDDWDRYITVGRQYAAAVKTGDPDRYVAVGRRGDDVVRRIARFARGNHMDACIL